jgi:hypothetical protein
MKFTASLATMLLASIGAFNKFHAPVLSTGRKPGKRNGRGKPGAYGRGLRNAITAKTKTFPALCDENGAYTLVGRDPLRRIDKHGNDVRRMWLAGISAQRGY